MISWDRSAVTKLGKLNSIGLRLNQTSFIDGRSNGAGTLPPEFPIGNDRATQAGPGATRMRDRFRKPNACFAQPAKVQFYTHSTDTLDMPFKGRQPQGGDEGGTQPQRNFLGPFHPITLMNAAFKKMLLGT